MQSTDNVLVNNTLIQLVNVYMQDRRDWHIMADMCTF